jgi:thioredoxin reductase
MSHYKVAIVGAGFVGIPTASVLALRNPSIEVRSTFILVCGLRCQRLQNIKMQKRPTSHLRAWPGGSPPKNHQQQFTIHD